MGDGRIAGYDEVEVGDHRGRIDERIGAAVELGSEILDPYIAGRLRDLVAPIFLLQADQADALELP